MEGGCREMSVTIKDIAKIAKVSHMTVSRALNDSELVKDDTKRMIKKIAEELNYVKNFNGRNLVLNKFFNIGLFITSMKEGTSPNFLNEVITYIYTYIRGRYSLILGSINDSTSIHDLNHQNFDGMIIISQSTTDDYFIESVAAKGIPLVIMNRKYDGMTCVLSDDAQGAYQACKYIISKNHSRIAFVEGAPKSVGTVLRREGIDRALTDFKDKIESYSFLGGDYSLESGYKAGLEIAKMNDKPTAVFCYNDDMAIGLQRSFKDSGITEIAIMGFDDSVITKYVNPSITTIKRPMKIIAEKSIELLLSMIEGNKAEAKVYNYDQVIIERESL